MIAGSGSVAAKSIRGNVEFASITPQAPVTTKTPASEKTPRRLSFKTADFPTGEVAEKPEPERKTPDLITPAQAKKLENSSSSDDGRDLVAGISECVDQALMVMQNRMGQIEAAVKKDPIAFEKPSTEFDMLNAIYRTLQNVTYHLFKIERFLIGKKAVKCPKPIEGESGESIMIAMRSAMLATQEATARLVQVVKEKRKAMVEEKYRNTMLLPGQSHENSVTSKDVVGDKAFALLAKIEVAITFAATSAQSANTVATCTRKCFVTSVQFLIRFFKKPDIILSALTKCLKSLSEN
jgi:hypothetical protein